MLPGRYKNQLIVAVFSCWWWLSTDALSGNHVCIEKQKYNLTKVIKVRAPVAVRSYEWCLAIPPRCERWHTELRDVTRLETEERSADIPVCCAGFAVRDERCVPRCPPGRMGHICNIGCPDGQWGASCTHQCICPRFSTCDSKDGKCVCTEGWAGPSCDRKVDAVEVTHLPGLGLLNWKTETTTEIYSTSTSPRPVTQTTTLPPTTTAATTLPPTTNPAADVPITTTPAAVSSTIITYTAVSLRPTSTTSITSSTEKTTVTTSTAETLTKENINIPNNKFTSTFSNPRSTTTINESIDTILEMVTTNTTQTPTAATTVKATIKIGSPQTLNNVSITTTESTKLTTSVQIDGPPKEIWIKPAQQGENKSSETKLKSITESQRPSTKKPESTTVRTILLSIISTSNLTTVAQHIPHHSNVYKLKGIPSSESRIVNITKYPTSSTIRLNPTKFTRPNTQHTRTTSKLSMFQTDIPILKPNVTAAVNKFVVVTNNTNSASGTIIKMVHVNTNNDSNTMLTGELKTSTETTLLSPSRDDANLKLTDITPIPPRLHTNSPITENDITPYTITQQPSTNKSVTLSEVIFSKTLNVSKSKHAINAPSVSLPKTVMETSKTIHLEETNSTTESSKVVDKIIPKQSPKSSSAIAVNIQKEETIIVNQIKAETSTTDTPNAIKPITPNPFLRNRPNTKTLTRSNVTEKEFNMILMDAKKDAKDTMIIVNNKETNKHELTTENPLANEEETFNILTEPEHITSVIGEGSLERGGTDDLLSLLSIVGGGMLAVILVAVLIVMMERCRKSQHGGSVTDKSEELDLKVALPSHRGKSYVKSIFHSPLPEPPVYRNMKPVEQTNYMGQFSRPVVLHELSPALIDNFRGILESHYDHLPPRSSRPLSAIREQSYNSDTLPPSIENLPNEVCSIDNCQDHAHLHNRLYPVTESAIETLKLESEIPQSDYANVEPLYAEIPCWRPQSHYANEVVNLNSEAVTEL